MTTHNEPTRDEIAASLRAKPLTAEEVVQLPEEDRLGIALLFGDRELRAKAFEVLVEQVKLELRTELPPNVIPIKPDIRIAAIGYPVTPQNAHNVERMAMQEVAQLNTERMRIHHRLADVEARLNGANEKLRLVREVRQEARAGKRGAPNNSRVTMHEGVTHGDPDDAA